MSPFLDCILGYHTNPLTCGVAKFNALLARQFGVPVCGIFTDEARVAAQPLVSIKVSELGDQVVAEFEPLLAVVPWRRHFHLFLHEWQGTPLEERLLRSALTVFCGNAELVARLREVRPDVVDAWCPSTLMSTTRFKPAELSIFSFGMAHKVRVELYRKLYALLERTGRSYSVYLSTALHDGTSFGESFVNAFDELREIFGEAFYFLGYLSDAAVYNHLVQSTFCAGFFEHGVRANNTSVHAAMQSGAIVITNLDQFSPACFVHGSNVLDIARCERLPIDPEELRAIRARSLATAEAVMNWERLVALMAQSFAVRRELRGGSVSLPTSH